MSRRGIWPNEHMGFFQEHGQLKKYAVMRMLDQNNKYGIQDSGLLVESDVLEQYQWYGVDSSLDFSSTVGVKDPFLIENTCSFIFVPESPSF